MRLAPTNRIIVALFLPCVFAPLAGCEITKILGEESSSSSGITSDSGSGAGSGAGGGSQSSAEATKFAAIMGGDFSGCVDFTAASGGQTQLSGRLHSGVDATNQKISLYWDFYESTNCSGFRTMQFGFPSFLAYEIKPTQVSDTYQLELKLSGGSLSSLALPISSLWNFSFKFTNSDTGIQLLMDGGLFQAPSGSEFANFRRSGSTLIMDFGNLFTSQAPTLPQASLQLAGQLNNPGYTIGVNLATGLLGFTTDCINDNNVLQGSAWIRYRYQFWGDNQIQRMTTGFANQSDCTSDQSPTMFSHAGGDQSTAFSNAPLETLRRDTAWTVNSGTGVHSVNFTVDPSGLADPLTLAVDSNGNFTIDGVAVSSWSWK